ncbi:hypothetical protein [Engelhardtia mirabilis]|uniref:Uncharacterized protein n=1 Tax=Engelhardtia mirabilis TaxID=2528011 RepID=A0A518BEP9_9BACT|nr:hypothetical protein Pla133_04280 [Planctomycetes bacterium Pla133]QDU99689.1 hypothetical protein Pla86_04280 [Planctomycetes bacterium Pla86]
MTRLLRSRSALLALPLALSLALSLTACAGTRVAGEQGTVYATSFNLVGLSIPFNDYDKAQSMVPEGSEIETIIANPRDWTSVIGILTSILGFSSTQISYVTEND